jgi:hypothetical protein
MKDNCNEIEFDKHDNITIGETLKVDYFEDGFNNILVAQSSSVPNVYYPVYLEFQFSIGNFFINYFDVKTFNSEYPDQKIFDPPKECLGVKKSVSNNNKVVKIGKFKKILIK